MRRGRPSLEWKATIHPTIDEIKMAATYYEGEGHMRQDDSQVKVIVGQNNRERLDWLRDRFGGKVYGPYKNSVGNETYQWRIADRYARGFIFTVFSLVSRTEKDRIKSVLSGGDSNKLFKKYAEKNPILKDEIMKVWDCPEIPAFGVKNGQY